MLVTFVLSESMSFDLSVLILIYDRTFITCFSMVFSITVFLSHVTIVNKAFA